MRFDGSVIVERTAGQIGSRCDHEPFSMLTVNLGSISVDIMGRRRAEEARDLYGERAAAFVMGRDAPYAEPLLFQQPAGDTADPDESIGASDMLEQMMEEAKDLVGEGSAAVVARCARERPATDDAAHQWVARPHRPHPIGWVDGVAKRRLPAAP